MSDKNFKVKNGLDAVGPITISPSSNSITSLIINSVSGGTGIIFNRNGSSVASIDDWGTYNGSGINIVQNWTVRSPGIEAQSFFWVGSGARSSAGFSGTNSGTNPVIYISQNGTATNDLTQWIKADNTVLAKVDYLGNLTANDLTLAGNLTVNGTTTNLNSTNLVVEDKNIIIADVTTPTDTTADGAGITIKGATDKTFSWINSTKSFTSSEPLIINNSSITTVPLVIKGYASQTANLTEWQDSAGSTLSRVSPAGSIFVSSSGTRLSGVGGDLVANAASATVVPIISRGFTSQTADLQQWQNSESNILLAVTQNGSIYNPSTIGRTSLGMQSATGSVGGAYFQVFGNNYSTSNQRGGAEFVFSSENSGTGGFTVFQYQSGAWNPKFKIFNSGYTSINSTSSTLGSSSATHQLGVVSASAATVGAVIRGAASQTANLQEWQNSAGSTLAYVNNQGYANFAGLDNLGLSSIGTPISATASLLIDTNTTTRSGIIIKGAASQTANLQEWQNSAGSVIASVSSVGNFISSNSTGFSIIGEAFYGSLNGGSTARVQAGNSVGANPHLVVRQVSAATGNLQEWQNSSGTVLASISSAGKLTSAVDASINGLKIGLGSASISSNLAFGANSLNGNTTGNNNIAIGGASLFSNTTGSSNTAIGSAALYANTVGGGNMAIGFEALNQNIDGQYNTAIGSQSLRNSNAANYNVSIGLQSMYYNTSGASNTSIGSVALLSNTSGNANIAIGYGALYSNTSGYNNTAIGANAGYSNVTGIQNVFIGSSAGYNETGSNKLYIANTNTATPLIGGDFSAKTLTIAGNASIISQNASSTGLLVKAAVSQTGSIIEWQNSSGTTIGEINNQGIFRNTYNYVQNLQGLGGGSGLYLNDVTTTAFNANPAHLVFKVQGFASQSANLQEWQDSTGGLLAVINNSGQFATYGRLTVGSSSVSTDARMVLLNTGTTTSVLQIIRGIASQTGDLTQWQNSSGTVLASVSSTGKLTITNTSAATSLIEVNGAGGGNFTVSAYGGISTNAGLQSIGSTSYFGGYGGASNLVLNVTGASGQTGDLQRWTNFAGTILAKVDSLGNFTATSKSFDIEHPTKENMRLRYGSLEGPENGVYIRGTVESNVIELPEYWTELVHKDSITASLTPVGSAQNIYVEKIENNKIYIGGDLQKAFFTVYGERKDIDKITVEY